MYKSLGASKDINIYIKIVNISIREKHITLYLIYIVHFFNALIII